MGDIEQHANLVHLLQQSLPVGVESPFASCPEAVGAGAIMGRSQQPQSSGVPVGDLFGIQDGGTPLHAQNKSQGGLADSRGRRRQCLPFCDVPIKSFLIFHLSQHASSDHRVVVEELPSSHRVSGLTRLRKRQRFILAVETRQQRDDHQPHTPPTQLVPRDRTGAGNDLIEMLLELANFRGGKHQITVPLECIPGHVEVSIKDEHRTSLPFLV